DAVSCSVVRGKAWGFNRYGRLGGIRLLPYTTLFRSTYSTAASIGGTTAAALYQTERYNTGPVEYLFTAPNGSYNVKLKFAEIYISEEHTSSLKTLIDVVTLQTRDDTIAQAGGANLAE